MPNTVKRKSNQRKSGIKLSILIPAYNEADHILGVLTAIKKTKLPKYEVIVIDDASTDKTNSLLKKNSKLWTHLIKHSHNQGKSGAIVSGIRKSRGDIIIIQDADGEYDPTDIPVLIEPILSGKADVVYGSRFKGHLPHRILYFSHYVANQLLTFLCNVVTNLNLSDMETGYKAIRQEFLKELTLSETGFGLEPEITLKLATQKARFYEVGIQYHGRTYEDGKKITAKDGLQAIWIIVKHVFQKKY